MAQTPEGKVKAAIKKYLTSQAAYYFMPIGGPYSVHGTPDIIACWRGLFFGIEAKAPGRKGTTTPNQVQALASITESGGIAVVADCVEDVKAAFEHAHNELLLRKC